MHRISLVLASLILLQVMTMGTGPAHAATVLYPDLKTLPPTDLRYDTVTINGSKQQVLRFSNRVWNAGQGPLDLRGISSVYSEMTTVYQRVYDDTGALVTQHQVGKFTFHPEHNHWHFEDFSDFELWTKATFDSWLASGRTKGTPLHSSPKTTSCVMDSSKVKNLPNTPEIPAYSSVCGTRTQGISVGWEDLYGYYLYGQWIDLGTSRLPNGKYVVRSVADPDNRLYESVEKNNAGREGALSNEGVTYFEVSNGTIRLDTTAPTMSAPVARPALNTTVRNDSVPAMLTWSATDALSGVAAYQVQQSVNGGSFTTLLTTGAKSSLRYLVPGKSYRFQVRAKDRAGNWSAWKLGPTFMPVARQETSATYAGTWITSALPSAYGGQLKRTSLADSTAEFAFTSRKVALVSTKGADRGQIEVYVDDALMGNVDLYSSTFLPRTVVFVRTLPTSGEHVLKVKVLSSKNPDSKGTRVDVDGFYVMP